MLSQQVERSGDMFYNNLIDAVTGGMRASHDASRQHRDAITNTRRMPASHDGSTSCGRESRRIRSRRRPSRDRARSRCLRRSRSRRNRDVGARASRTDNHHSRSASSRSASRGKRQDITFRPWALSQHRPAAGTVASGSAAGTAARASARSTRRARRDRAPEQGRLTPLPPLPPLLDRMMPDVSRMRPILAEWARARNIIDYLDIDAAEALVESVPGSNSIRCMIEISLPKGRVSRVPADTHCGGEAPRGGLPLYHGTSAAAVARIVSCGLLVRGSVESGLEGKACVCGAVAMNTCDYYTRAHPASAFVPVFVLLASRYRVRRACIMMMETWYTLRSLRLLWTGGALRTTPSNLLLPEGTSPEFGLCRQPGGLLDEPFMRTWEALPTGYFERTCHQTLPAVLDED